MKHELFPSCWDCLTEISIDVKLAKVQYLANHWYQGNVEIKHTSDCLALETPGLPRDLQLVHPSKVERRRLGSSSGRLALLHALAHIEYSAINLALDAVYRFRDMPDDYYADWLRVAVEECYHFGLLRHHLRLMDSDYGHLTAHNGLWDVAVYSASDVVMRMALVPRVLEARGLDVTPSMIDRVNEVGDTKLADILGIILRDEVRHVRTGSYWFKVLCDQRHLDSVNTFDEIIRQYKCDLNAHIKGPFHIAARLQAGFNQAEINNLSRYA